MDAADEAAQAQQDLQMRLYRVNGNSGAADLLELVIDQQKEYQDYLAKGYDVTELLIVQQLEYEKAVKDVSSTLKEASNDLTIAADKIKEKLSAAVSAQMQIMETLKSLLGGDLSTLSPEAKYTQASAAFTAAADRAKLGDVTAMQSVSQLAQDFLSASRNYNASNAAYATDFEAVTQALAELGGLPSSTEIQIDVAQQQLERLTEIQTAISEGNIDQLTYLREILGSNSGTFSLLEQYLAADAAAREETANQQAEALARAEFERQKNSDLAAAQTAYEQAMKEITAKGATAEADAITAMRMGLGLEQQDLRYDLNNDSKVNTGDAIIFLTMRPGNPLYESWVAAATQAFEDARTEINSRVFSYDVGTPYVSYDQLAQIHRGEMVIDPSSAAALRRYGITVQAADNYDTVNELRALVRLQSAGNTAIIAELAEVKKELATLTSKARLEAMK